MKQVFVSDFDGIIYLPNAAVKLPPENVEMIRRYQDAGHLFGFCTSRPLGGLTPFINGLIAPDFYVTSNGANILDGALKPIFRRGIDRDAADAVIQALQSEKNCRLMLDVEGDLCVFARMDYPGFYRVISGADDAPPGLIHQISIRTEGPAEAAAVQARIRERCGSEVGVFLHGQQVDVCPTDCTKANGLSLLRDWLRKRGEEVRLYGIASSKDDLALVELLDVSYTFPTVSDIVWKKVTKTVPTVVHALLDSV